MFDDAENEVVEEKVSLLEYHCDNCDTKFYTSEKHIFNKCIFCDNTNISKSEASISKNVRIIPFKKKYVDARKDYNKKVKFNPLIPLVFKKKKIIASLQKLYVPTLITNISNEGEVIYLGGEKGNIGKDKIIETKKYEIIQKVKFNYDDVILKINNKVDQEAFNIINNYSFFDIRDINSNYFDDSFYLSENISINEISDNAKDDISKYSLDIVRGNVKHSLKKLDTNNTITKFENTREVLLPVYVLIVKYKNKDYTYIMNGQNGNSYLNIPLGTFELIMFSVLSFAIIFAISFLISYFL